MVMRCPTRPYVKLLAVKEKIDVLIRIEDGASSGSGSAFGSETRC